MDQAAARTAQHPGPSGSLGRSGPGSVTLGGVFAGARIERHPGTPEWRFFLMGRVYGYKTVACGTGSVAGTRHLGKRILFVAVRRGHDVGGFEDQFRREQLVGQSAGRLQHAAMPFTSRTFERAAQQSSVLGRDSQVETETAARVLANRPVDHSRNVVGPDILCTCN